MKSRITFASLLIMGLITVLARPAFADPLTLSHALSHALSSNPEIAAQAERATAEHGAIRSSYSLDNPHLGIMRETNMTFMEQQMGPMNSWSLSQDFKFPTKYFLLGSAQSSRAKAADQELSGKKLEIRRKVITAYYNLFSVNRVIELLKAQRETLQEVARSAESRHAVGAVPQQDEMKAHTEQTKIEADLISAREEQSVAEARLNALMGRGANAPIELPATELGVPTLKIAPSKIDKLATTSSTQIRAAEDLADSAHTTQKLAAWNFAPDFSLRYAQAYGNAPPDAYAVSVEVSVPLWFFAKQSGELKQAEGMAGAAERNLDLVRLNTQAAVRSLVSKVTSHQQLLAIYETSLIPQATTTLASSRGAYQAGKTDFLELLDSERSLYDLRIAYYRTLSQYVEYLTSLEEIAGRSLSTLPMGESR